MAAATAGEPMPTPAACWRRRRKLEPTPKCSATTSALCVTTVSRPSASKPYVAVIFASQTKNNYSKLSVREIKTLVSRKQHSTGKHSIEFPIERQSHGPHVLA